MLEGDAVNGDTSVFEDELVLAYVNRMEEHFVLNLRVVSAHEELKQLDNLLRPMNVELGCSSQQVHRAYQSRQPEDVVAMIVTDENVPDVHHREPHPLHLSLCAFATINHEEFAPHIQYLRGWLVTRGGLCRAATQYV